MGCPGGNCGTARPAGVISLPARKASRRSLLLRYRHRFAPQHLNMTVGWLGERHLLRCHERSVDGTTFVRDDIGLHPPHATNLPPQILQLFTPLSTVDLRSEDAGDNWIRPQQHGFSATQFQDIALHPSNRFFRLRHSDNGTNFLQPDGTWRRADFGDGGYASSIKTPATPPTDDVPHLLQPENNYSRLWPFLTSIRRRTTAGSFSNCTTNRIRCLDNVLFYAPMTSARHC